MTARSRSRYVKTVSPKGCCFPLRAAQYGRYQEIPQDFNRNYHGHPPSVSTVGSWEDYPWDVFTLGRPCCRSLCSAVCHPSTTHTLPRWFMHHTQHLWRKPVEPCLYRRAFLVNMFRLSIAEWICDTLVDVSNLSSAFGSLG